MSNGDVQLARSSSAMSSTSHIAKGVTFSNSVCLKDDELGPEEVPVLNFTSADHVETPIKHLPADLSFKDLKPTSTSTPNLREVSPHGRNSRPPLIKAKSLSTDSNFESELEDDGTEPENDMQEERKEANGDIIAVHDGTLEPGLLQKDISCLMVPGAIHVPIVGYEVMESRSKFTLYKVHVIMDNNDVGWFIFRRYSDFVHLNDELQVLFPNFRLSLPPKRWFRDNFDADFLEDRQLGLQAFLNNITGHRDICVSQPVREFFCFDDPPGPHESLEESRAQCECMEEMLYLLRKDAEEKATEIELLRDELDLYKNQVRLLTNRLSELNKVCSPGSKNHDSFLSSDGKLDVDALFGSGDKLIHPHLMSSITDIHIRENSVDEK